MVQYTGLLHIWKKPRVAFLSPFPPEESGCARFTERTIRAASSPIEIDLYTKCPKASNG